MTSKCHVGPCSSCSLCNTSNLRYMHPAVMKEKNREVYTLLQYLRPRLSDTACVCAPCAKQLSRNISSENFYPRWLPGFQSLLNLVTLNVILRVAKI